MCDRGGLEVLLRILAWAEDGEGERKECAAGGRQVRVDGGVSEGGEGERKEGADGVWQVRVEALRVLQVLLEGMQESAQEEEWVQLHSAMSAGSGVKGVVECCSKAWVMSPTRSGGINPKNEKVLWAGCRVLWLLSHSAHVPLHRLVEAEVCLNFFE
jgi:hypothetical protein